MDAGADARDAPEDPDAGAPLDAGAAGDTADARAVSDAGTGAGPDAGAELLGTLRGACGVLGPMLTSAEPALVENVLEFAAGETYGKDALSPGGDRLFDTPNAGGSSGESEVMSFEVLRACEGADLTKTETEIGYAPPDDAGPSSITDLLVTIGGKKVGVSVTRAYKPPSQPLDDADVRALLVKKLEGINRSSQRVVAADRWVKQVLHVFAVDQAAADAVARVVPTLDAALRADTVVLVTRTVGGGFLYCNPDPPLGSECR